MSAESLGYAAAFLTTISFFPQAVKTLRSGETRSISLGMYALFTAGVAPMVAVWLDCRRWPGADCQSDHPGPGDGCLAAQDCCGSAFILTML